MPLQKQIVPINFAGGLDTKSDSKTVIPGKLLSLENGVFKKGNRIDKRNGYDVLGLNIVGSASEIEEGAALSVYNDELNLFTGTKLYTFADSLNSYVDKGRVTSVTTSNMPILVNSYEQKNVTMATNSGITVYAWEDSRGGTRYSVFDQVTGSAIVSDQVLAASSTRPRVVAFGQFLVLFYSVASNTSVRYKTISIVAPSTLGSETTVTTDMNATPNYDVIKIADKLFFCHFDDTTTITIRTIDTSFIISGATFIAESAAGGISVVSDSTDRAWFIWHTGSNMRVAVYNYIMGSVLSPTTLEATASTIRNITGYVVGDTLTAFYEVNAASTFNQLIRTNTMTSSGTAGTASVFERSVGLASKAFENNGTWYVTVIHQSTLQPTYFVVDQAGTIVAKVNALNAGNLIDNRTLSEVPEISTGTRLLACGYRTSIQSENNTIFSLIGISANELRFNSDKTFLNAQLGELHIVGGILQAYDGISVVEHGFHLFPENVTTGTATTGGSMVAGTYQVRVCYEWTDNLGQIHRSAPSVAQSQVIPGGTSTNTLTVTIPTLRLTAKTGSRANVRLVVYGTTAGGTLFYRLTSITAPTYNDTTVDSVTFTRTAADASILSNDLLYTTGGILENIPAPSCSLITTYKNRVFLAGLDDKLAFWYSKEKIQNAPVEFSDFLTGRVDPFGGDITAIGALDNYVVFFKRSAIFVFTGNGPNDTGSQSDYGQPQLITTDVGCDNPNTVVITPEGLMFKSTKGIYLLDRGLSVSYVGADVEEFNDKTITSSKLLSDKNEVRFTTNDDTCLVYNYFFKDERGIGQWSTFTNHTAEDAEIWQNSFVFLKPSGQVWVENNESYNDNGVPIVLSLTTAWMSLAGLQGFERVYRMIVLGEYKSPHKLQIEIGYDFNPTFTQSALIELSDIYTITSYGEDSPYGAGTPYGGEFPLYQFKTHMTKQKCQSVRFKISDNQYSVVGEYGEGFNITNLALEVGVKGTLRKFATKNSFSTSG